MFKSLKQLFSKKNKDLRKRLYFTILVLTIYVVGISIEVPGTQDITKNLGFLELLNVMGGGALKNFSIFSQTKFVKCGTSCTVLPWNPPALSFSINSLYIDPESVIEYLLVSKSKNLS